MSTTLEKVTKDAMQLTSHQRLVLAGLLLELEDASNDPAIDAVWEQEIQDRIRAVDSGDVTGVPYEDVMREADSRLAP